MNEFEVNDLSVGMDYLPKEVYRKVNKNIAHGGGGGGGTTSTNLDDRSAQSRDLLLGRLDRAVQSGAGEQVANTANQRGALAAAQGFAEKQLQEGLGQGAMTRALRATEGQQQAGRQGALGSSRGQRSLDAALLDREIGLQQADQQIRQQGAQGAVQAAAGQRGLAQELLDAPLRGLKQYSGILSGLPLGQETKQSGGGK